jgi:hypothetical protein
MEHVSPLRVTSSIPHEDDGNINLVGKGQQVTKLMITQFLSDTIQLQTQHSSRHDSKVKRYKLISKERKKGKDCDNYLFAWY